MPRWRAWSTGGRPRIWTVQHLQQIGGALGVALFSTVSTNRTQHLLAEGESRAQALTSGFALSFWVAVGFGVAALLAALLMIHREELATAPAEA